MTPQRWTGLTPDNQAVTWVDRGPNGDLVVWKSLSQPDAAEQTLWRAGGWIEGIHWLDKQLLVRTRDGQRVRWYRVDWPGGGQKLLLAERVKQRNGPQLVKVLDDGQVFFSNDRRNPWQPDLFRLRLSGGIKQVENNPGDVFRWHPAPNGKVLLARRWRVDQQGPLYEWIWRSSSKHPWKTLRQRRLNQEPWRLVEFSVDATRARLRSESNKETRSLNLLTGQWTDEYPSGNALAGIRAPTEPPILWQSDSSGAFAQSSAEDLAAVGQQAAGRRLFWLGQSPMGSVWQTGPDPAGLQILTVTGSSAQHWQGVALDAGSPVTVQNIQSRDGHSIEVLITATKTAAKGVVLLVHGGPWSFDRSASWHAEAQWLAEQGFSVLQVNFRGSTNQGIAWQWAGRRQWSGKMLDDLEDAIVWARRQRLPGSDRVCAMGSSFGGYAAVMLAARPDPLTRCTVARAAVSDVPAQIQYLKRIGNHRGYQEWREMVGTPDSPDIAMASPLGVANAIGGPVLLGHGELDDVVDISQSLGLLESLRAARSASADLAPVQWLVLRGQGHDLRGQAARSAWYSKVARFLDRALADDG